MDMEEGDLPVAPPFDFSELRIACPECDAPLPLTEIMDHVQAHHPLLYMVWTNVFAWPNDADDAITDDYESLTELCDRIGYHEVGVDNVDDVLEAAAEAGTAGVCPICLEAPEYQEWSALKVCRHAFCDPCIRRWLAGHKTCPVCKREAAADVGAGMEAAP